MFASRDATEYLECGPQWGFQKVQTADPVSKRYFTRLIKERTSISNPHHSQFKKHFLLQRFRKQNVNLVTSLLVALNLSFGTRDEAKGDNIVELNLFSLDVN